MTITLILSVFFCFSVLLAEKKALELNSSTWCTSNSINFTVYRHSFDSDFKNNKKTLFFSNGQRREDWNHLYRFKMIFDCGLKLIINVSSIASQYTNWNE